MFSDCKMYVKAAIKTETAKGKQKNLLHLEGFLQNSNREILNRIRCDPQTKTGFGACDHL